MNHSPDDGPSPRTSAHPRILVVDDEKSVRDAVARTLRRQGYDVECADSGETALTIFDRGREFSMVVSDVVMPGMSGVDLVKQLKRRNERLHLLLISGYPGRHLDNAGMGLTKSDLLQKPFTPKQLTVRVRQKLALDDVHQPTDPILAANA